MTRTKFGPIRFGKADKDTLILFIGRLCCQFGAAPYPYVSASVGRAMAHLTFVKRPAWKSRVRVGARMFTVYLWRFTFHANANIDLPVKQYSLAVLGRWVRRQVSA